MKKIIILFTILLLLAACASKKVMNPNELGKVWPSESLGYINNRHHIDSLLTIASDRQINSSKPIVIIYHPGKDECNSSGSSTRRSIKAWYNLMEKNINKIKETNFIYIYKDTTGLYGRHDGYKKWIKDPNSIIEKSFFKNGAVCSGYVVISENADYISCNSEFDKDFLKKRFQYIISKE